MNPLKLHRMVASILVASTCWTLSSFAEEHSSDRTTQRDDSTSASTTASTQPGSRSTAALVNQLGKTIKADKLIGMDVQNNQQQKIGDVNNLAIDLANGRVVAVVVSTGGFLGIGDTLSAVPPQAFQLDASQDSLRLDVNKETLTSYPRLKATEWERLHDPSFVASIYQAYRVPPYWQHEAAGAGGRVSGSTTVQGTNLTDQELATRIRSALAGETSLSSEARNIKVEIDDGEIELEGTVASEAEKQRVLDIVRRAAPGSQLDDELKVK